MRPVAMTGVRDREIASDYEGGKGLCLVAWLESLKYFWRCLFAPFLHSRMAFLSLPACDVTGGRRI